MTDDRARRQWMAMLGKLVYPADPVTATKALCDMLPMLADMPDRYFTAQSLDFVARNCKRIPSYGELRGHLGGWWKETMAADQRLGRSEYPAFPTTQRAPNEPPSEAEKHIVGEMVRAFRATTSAPKSMAQLDEKERPTPRHLLDGQLLAEYDKVARDERYPQKQRDAAAYRARFLCRKLGLDVVSMAAE